MVSYFHGSNPVRVYFADGKIRNLDQPYTVDINNEIIAQFAKIYGTDNLALI